MFASIVCMDKFIKHAHALAVLLVLLLTYFSTPVQCGITEDMGNKKLYLPDGLCVNKARVRTCDPGCMCCLVTNVCYLTMAECKEQCDKTAYSAPANKSPFALP
uniref:Uncharacterized protein n=1 Tax=Avena sativa TaxID=4498 RepID=A0ACD5Y367_AVESA